MKQNGVVCWPGTALFFYICFLSSFVIKIYKIYADFHFVLLLLNQLARIYTFDMTRTPTQL